MKWIAFLMMALGGFVLYLTAAREKMSMQAVVPHSSSSSVFDDSGLVEIGQPVAERKVISEPLSGSDKESAEPPAANLTESRRHVYLRAGLHEQLGISGDVTAELRQLAQGDLVKLWRASEYKRASGVLGLSGWSSMEDAIAAAAENDPAMHQELGAVAADALTLANQVNMLAQESFITRVGLEEWGVGSEHDAELWRQEYGFSGSAGALRFTSSVAIGGINYRVHFDSSRHPNIEHQIRALRANLLRIKPFSK